MSNLAPSQTQTTSADPTVGQRIKTGIKSCFDVRYFSTIHFVMRLMIIIMGIGGLISVNWAYKSDSYAQYFTFVGASAVIDSLLFILLYFFTVSQRLTMVPWTLIETIKDLIFFLFYLIASSMVTDRAAKFSNAQSFGAAAFFGWFSTILYLIDAIWNFFQWKRGVTHRGGSSTTTRSTKQEGNFTATTISQQATY